MFRTLLGVVIGIVLACAAAFGIAYVAVTQGWIPAQADAIPSDLERWAARTSLKATLHREATMTSPLPASDENLMDGAKLYAGNCAGCHGTPGDPTPSFGKGFMPPPPLFGDGETVSDDPEGWSYWQIKHGIRWTGMPAFKSQLAEADMWKLALFLKHMDKLPPKVNFYWRHMK